MSYTYRCSECGFLCRKEGGAFSRGHSFNCPTSDARDEHYNALRPYYAPPRKVPAWATRCPCGDFWRVCDLHREEDPALTAEAETERGHGKR